MQVDLLSRIKDLPLKLGTFKKMPRLRFLKFYLPYADIFLPPNQDGNLWFGQHEFPLLLSACCEELMKVASEIHIKCVDYLYIDGCSHPSRLNKSSVTSPLGSRGMEPMSLLLMLWKEPLSSLRNLECSDMLDQQWKTLSDELLCLRSTYYLKLSKKSTGQDSGKPKLHILFDGLRFYERISVSQLENSNVGQYRVWFLFCAGFNFLLYLFLRRPWFQFLFSFPFQFFCTFFLYLFSHLTSLFYPPLAFSLSWVRAFFLLLFFYVLGKLCSWFLRLVEGGVCVEGRICEFLGME